MTLVRQRHRASFSGFGKGPAVWAAEPFRMCSKEALRNTSTFPTSSTRLALVPRRDVKTEYLTRSSGGCAQVRYI